MVIILSFQTNLEIGLPALAVSLLASFFGITYIAIYEFSRMKGPGFSRLNRLLGLGIIFSSGGWFFLLATAVATSSTPSGGISGSLACKCGGKSLRDTRSVIGHRGSNFCKKELRLAGK